MNNIPKICFFLFLIYNGNPLLAQTIQGKVLDGSNYQALPNATIINITDSTGTITDDSGLFQITAKANDVLRVSHVGYAPKNIMVSQNNDFVRVDLQASESNLHEVIVRASHISQRQLEVPGALSVITKKQLERGDETIITPMLNRISGVYMHSGSLNTNRITIRGIGARTPYGTNKIRAYFDEIPLTSGEGSTALEDIDLTAIQRVEIIKGPASSIYGAGLGGTINLTSRTPDVMGVEAGFQTLMGSYGLFRNIFQYGHNNNSSQINLTYANTHSDGFRKNSEYDRQSFITTGKFSPGRKSIVAVLGTFTHLKAYIPSSIDAETFRENPSTAAFTWNQAQGFESYNKGSLGLSYQYEISPNVEHVTSVFMSFRDANEPRPFDILRENTIAAGARFKLIAKSRIFNRNTTFSVGAEYFNDWHEWSLYENLYQQNAGNGSLLGENISDNEERRYYSNVFGQINLEISEKLALQTGLNFNNTSYELTDLYTPDGIDRSGGYSFSSIWSPRLGITYTITPDHALYATISHGFSPPSVAETLTPEGNINTDIQPETGWNYEIGSKGSWFNNRIYTELAFYKMEIKNLLVAQRTGPDQYVGVNAGKTIHNGIELLINSELLNDKNWSVKPFVSASFMNFKFDDFIDDEEDYSGNDLTGVPSGIYNLGVDISTKFGFYFYSNFRHVGDIPLNDSNSIYSDSYNLLDCKVGYEFTILKRLNLNFSAGINNAADESYASMVLVNAIGFGGASPRYYYPGMPRNYFGSLGLRYVFD